MQCHRNYFLVGLLFFVQFFCSQNVYPKDQDERSAVLEFYFEAAFSNKDRLLKRFPQKSQFKVTVVCADENCNALAYRLKGYLPKNLFDIEISEQLDSQSDANILVLSEKDKSKNEAHAYTKIFNLGDGEILARDGVYGCVSLSIIHQNSSQIRQIAVVTVGSGDVLRETSCILVQLTRGSGLNFSSTSTEFWTAAKKAAEQNPDAIEKFLTVMATVISVHFNQHTYPGMSKDATFQALSAQSIEQLKGDVND
jgi:hypothetical protein